MEDNKPKLAVFDFDGTLCSGNSFIKFAGFARGRVQAALAALTVSPWLIGWKLGRCSNHEAKRRLFAALFRGMTYDEFCSLGTRFATELESFENAETVRALHNLRTRGWRVVIATASMGEWVRPWAAVNGVDLVAATEPEVADGRLTGNFATANCYGPEKVRRLRQDIPDLDKYRIMVVTDSEEADAALLAIAHQTKIIKNVKK